MEMVSNSSMIGAILVVLYFFTVFMHSADAQLGTIQITQPASLTGGELFGRSIDILDSIAAASSMSQGLIYFYKEQEIGVWNEVGTIAKGGDVYSGWGSAVEFATNVTFFTSAPYGTTDQTIDHGYVFVYTADDESHSSWTEGTPLHAGDAFTTQTDDFGFSLSAHDDILFVGAGKDDSKRGSAYVFQEVAPGVWLETTKLVGSLREVNTYFAWIDGITSENETFVGGCPNLQDHGNVFVFERVSAGDWDAVDILIPAIWNETAMLGSDDAAQYDKFGERVAISGGTIVATAEGNDEFGSESGAVYVFRKVADEWTQVSKVTASDARTDHFFGTTVALDGPLLAVNAAFGGPKIYLFLEDDNGDYIEQFVGPSLTATLAGSDFGEMLKISGNTLLIPDRVAEEYVGVWATGAVYFVTFDTNLNDCAMHECLHASTCVDAFMNYTCECPQTYDGHYCGICQCENGGVCDGTATCDCSGTEYIGDLCTDSCHNGVSGVSGSQACDCTGTGATGTYCEIDIDDCLSSPCLNEGSCSDMGAMWHPNRAHEFNCSCNKAWSGDLCEISVCVSSPCVHGICQEYNPDTGKAKLYCNCTNTGFDGDLCQTKIDECASNPCGKGAPCIDMHLDFRCECNGTGFTGKTCRDDVDDCASNPCRHGGNCTDTGKNAYECTCAEGFEGDLCERELDECESDPCKRGGICIDKFLTFECNCTGTGYEGDTCQDPIDYCSMINACVNGATCVNERYVSICDCPPEYTGTFCEIILDPCTSSPCFHDTECISISNTANFFCECGSLYYGTYCQNAYACPGMSPFSCECAAVFGVGSEYTPSTWAAIEYMVNTYCTEDEDEDEADECNDCMSFSLEFDETSTGISVDEFLLSIPALLANETDIPAEDYSVFLMPASAGATTAYHVEIVVISTDTVEPDILKEQISDALVPQLDDDATLDNTVVVVGQEEQEEDDINQKESFPWVIVIIAGGIVFLLLAYYAYKHNSKAATRTRDIHDQVVGKHGKLAMPL